MAFRISRIIVCSAASWSGTWHRFIVLDWIRTFALHFRYQIHFLWGVSDGVSYCRFEELLSPIHGIRIFNVSEQEVLRIEKHCKAGATIKYRGEDLSVFRPGRLPSERMFVFDQSPAQELERFVPSRSRPSSRLVSTPSPDVQKKASAYIRQHDLQRRIGIRVRATECPIEARKPHRLQRELDDTVRSIIRLPWHVKIFVVTDSEYIQQMLASHFHDTRFLPKKFDLQDVGGRYIHRHDKKSMLIFMTEVSCLTACRKIINFGGFLNEGSVLQKTIQPPFRVTGTS